MLILRKVDVSVALVHRRQVDSGGKFDGGGLSGVVGATNNIQKVDSIVKICALGSHNGAIPVGKGLIITVGEAVGDALVTDLSLLSFFEFFKKFKSARF